ncbi:MAG TPA: hypothetical protein DIU00_21260 [Phycisphaerales bacterium]|nr:hypothetical protein [Phycisphaerales bacterium]
MTVESITNRLNQFFMWLSSRQLEEWWPVLIAIAALIILVIVLVIRSRRKVLPGNALLRDIIGIKLADDNKTGSRTDRTKKGRSAHAPEKRGRKRKRINTTKGFKLAIRELNQRRQELIKSRQAELRIRQEPAAMVTVNEQIQNEAQVEVAESRPDEELPEQKVAEIAAVIEQFQQQVAEYSPAEEYRKQPVSEFVGFNEPVRPEVTDSGLDTQHPVQKVYEILPIDEPLQIKVTGSSRAEELPVQKVSRIEAVNEQIPNEVTGSTRAEQHPIQKASEIAAVNELLQPEKPEPDQPSNAPEESPRQDLKSKKPSQPLDIAEFSKAAISRRQRQRSGIFNEYSDLDED